MIEAAEELSRTCDTEAVSSFSICLHASVLILSRFSHGLGSFLHARQMHCMRPACANGTLTPQTVQLDLLVHV